jgi:hypothetical protein
MTLIPDLERDLETAAAGRMRSVRRRAWRVAVVGVAAVMTLAVAVVALSSRDEGSGPTRAAEGGERPDTPAPPRGIPHPAPGTLVRLSTFDFRGVQYRLSGYLSRARGHRRNDSVCVQIKRTPPVGPGLDRPSAMCAGDGLLRRRLRPERVLNVGGGGGPPGRLEVTGFTVAGVSRVRAVGEDWPAHVELTRPWRPLNGERMRAFVIIVDPPRDARMKRDAFTPVRAVEAGR